MGLGLGPEAQAWRLAGLQAWMVGACGCVHGPLRGAYGQAQGRGSPAARIEWPNWTAEWKVWRWGGGQVRRQICFPLKEGTLRAQT